MASSHRRLDLYRYGHLTWDWKKGKTRIRSYLHPIVFSFLYKVLALFHLDSPLFMEIPTFLSGMEQRESFQAIERERKWRLKAVRSSRSMDWSFAYGGCALDFVVSDILLDYQLGWIWWQTTICEMGEADLESCCQQVVLPIHRRIPATWSDLPTALLFHSISSSKTRAVRDLSLSMQQTQGLWKR
ncbi:hypothetical protein Vadar_011622 [Vaccinium darrowii]|uniref:Uncharacterized protein n=1 Tax=Vaccinium darrowii TaxID=229202 RepID=A0ACB7XGY7_9ERIC|nr:hypothetical protein Vadar_011622 [Vaccinium darrowii]